MYSQNNEESAIAAATAGMRPGRFLDIGAADGATFSNTMALVDRGWSGLLVEPECNAFMALHARHSGNPKLELMQAVIGCERGITKFWSTPDCVSSTVPAHVEKWRKVGQYREPYWVPQVSIVDLLDKFPGPYDVVSIDTEGTSAALFFKLMQLLHGDPPRVLVVEHDGAEQGCISVVGARYEIVESNGENLVFVRRDRK